MLIHLSLDLEKMVLLHFEMFTHAHSVIYTSKRKLPATTAMNSHSFDDKDDHSLTKVDQVSSSKACKNEGIHSYVGTL